ncbi:ABC transporter [Streptomyces sp. NPDC051219]|uniref:ABC transporter n=1 Tax=Streptomyces sp. NPDC051219 TaxID=3155283 RepID=UPI00341C3115
MSNLTKTPAAGPNGSTASPASPIATRGPRLSGVTWLIWRQHRAAYWTLLAATALSVAWIVYQRAGLMEHLTAHGWPDSASGKWLEGMGPHTAMFVKVGFGLGFIPILLGVFLGAPLLAGDLENGTAKLVTSQSVSPVRWLAAKLGVSALVVVVCTVALSLQFGRWWGPVKNETTVLGWETGAAFDNTGPVPVALALFTVVGGVAIGMVLRRALIAMVVTFTFAVAVQVVWAYFRLDLGNIVTVTTNKGINVPSPRLPHGAMQIDQSYVTGAGETLGWSTCAHEASEKARDACVQKADIVGWSVDYLPISQMSGMQWFGASILFALTAAVAVFIFMWGRKRLV